ERRQELVDQIAVRAVDLHHVKAGARRAAGGLAPFSGEIAHLVMRHGARRRRFLGVRHGARRHQFPAVPVKDLRLVAAQRLSALPGAAQPRLAAGMAELQAGHRAMRLDEGGAARQRRNKIVVPQSGIADRAAAVARHFCGFHDDETGAALSVFAGVDEVPVGGKTLDRRILVHGRNDDAVLQADAPDLERRKQHRLRHRLKLPFYKSGVGVIAAPVLLLSSQASAFSAALPAYFAWLPNSCSIRSNWLYFAVRSDRASEPVLICPQLVAPARSAMVESSVSPERCD